MFPSVEVVQTGLVHSELHVGFPIRLSMNDEYHLIDPVGNKVLDTQVAQGYDIGNGIFTKPHTFVVAVHCCLVANCHCAAIDLKSHFSF